MGKSTEAVYTWSVVPSSAGTRKSLLKGTSETIHYLGCGVCPVAGDVQTEFRDVLDESASEFTKRKPLIHLLTNTHGFSDKLIRYLETS